MSRLFRAVCVVVISGSLAGCGDADSRWIPNEKLLTEIVTMDPETKPVQVGKAVRRFFDEASLGASNEDLKGKKRLARYRDVFGVLRSRYRDGGKLVAGFNVCFPESYSPSQDRGVPQLMIYGWECQLIQGNGPSVALLRKDPWVAKYLDENGELVARGDLEQMHDEINGAYYRIDPTNSQHSLYPDAQGNLEKVLRQWERPGVE
jgi:hypothetical protein